MRISAINSVYYQNKHSKSRNNLGLNPQSYNPSFGIANSGKLKILFSYGLPCMYSGIEMIDPKKVQKMLKHKVFNKPASQVLPLIEPFEKSIQEVEEKVYKVIKENAKIYPEKTFKEILQMLAPVYQRRLRKKQAPIFDELVEKSHNLPEGYRYKFKQFMNETNEKLNDKPILVPFSTTEFQYKLEKISDDVQKITNPKAMKVMRKLIAESQNLSKETNCRTIENQKKIINFMEKVLKTSVLNKNEQIKNLLNNSKSRLNGEKIKIPFNRKSFIYDLTKLLDTLPDKNLQYEMLSTATKLPTSRDSSSAYIIKFATESSEKIAYRLLWPFMASVEHLFPKSCGGEDKMSNFGGATTRENTERQNIDFVQQIKRKPNTKIFCQKYIDRLVEHLRNGVFQKNNIKHNYIEEFKQTIQKISRGAIVLDISKYKELAENLPANTTRF